MTDALFAELGAWLAAGALGAWLFRGRGRWEFPDNPPLPPGLMLLMVLGGAGTLLGVGLLWLLDRLE